MKRSIPRLCIAIIVIVVGVQSWRRQTVKPAQQGPSPNLAPCSDKQRALVDGLDVGGFIGEFEIVGFHCGETNVMEILLRRKDVPLTLMVAEPGAVPHNAPRQTPRHDLFYMKKNPLNEPPTQDEIDALLVLLSKRVEVAEKKLGSSAHL